MTSIEQLQNYDAVGRGLQLLKECLKPYVEKYFPNETSQDISKLLSLFRNRLDELPQPVPRRVRTLAHELTDVRNQWAHQESFSTEDAYRALDSAERLLRAIGESVCADRINAAKAALIHVSVTANPAETRPIVSSPMTPSKRVADAAGEPVLNQIELNIDPQSPAFSALRRRLNSITDQVYGASQMKAGSMPRQFTPLEFGWVRESRIEPIKDNTGEYLQIVLHIGDTKEQGQRFFDINPSGVVWPGELSGFKLVARPFIKIANAYASALMWICPTPAESSRTHTKQFFDSFAGKIRRADWPTFEADLSEYVNDWHNKCFVHDSCEPASWDKALIDTNRTSFLLAVGTNLRVLMPYKICQELDDDQNNSQLSAKYRSILEDVKRVVEEPINHRYRPIR